eukprot:1185192-Prorocentrum_minimum.AAC.2
MSTHPPPSRPTIGSVDAAVPPDGRLPGTGKAKSVAQSASATSSEWKWTAAYSPEACRQQCSCGGKLYPPTSQNRVCCAAIVRDLDVAGGELRSQGGELRSQGGELRSQVVELRSQGGELRRQGGELRSQGGELRSQGGELRSKGGELRSQVVELRSQGGESRRQGGELRSQGGELRGD